MNNQIRTEKNKHKKLIYILIIFIVSLVFLYISFLKIFKNIANKTQDKIINILVTKTKRNIEIGNLNYSFNSMNIKDIKITEPFTPNKVFLQTKNINLEFDPYIIISAKKLIINKVEIDSMSLYLTKNKTWNFKDITQLIATDTTPIFNQYPIKDMKINNSDVFIKLHNIELFLNKINTRLTHIINTAIFTLTTNFELISSINKTPFTAIFKANVKAILTEKTNEFKGDISIDNLIYDKLFISKFVTLLNYKKNSELKINVDINEVNGFPSYNKYKELNEMYTKIFNKNIPSSLNNIKFKLSISKANFNLIIRNDIFDLLSQIDFVKQTHFFSFSFLEIKATSNSILFKPKLSSNSSETINEFIKKYLRELENISFLLKEVI
ncbi:MAG: hypothetical protein N2Z20_02015 [Elusimicrobiales bacterium]|nr:hypothetical protein [Elusimicrobiales bacterium]